MNNDRMRRLRAYVLSADASMRRIPMPAPPKPEEGWDGPTFGAHEMYLAYSQLPTDLQELAATTHVLCENALQAQRGAALRALTARYAMVVNANLSLGEDDHDPPVGPILIPAKSTQHRVLRVRKDRDRTRPVKLRLLDAPEAEVKVNGL